ncbi:DUF5689 domain-containing protein [Aequorivita marisscotiae]|uniref:DUF5689 domain-containing protein n=1 Tax=Aequorivita marisscotiae TaxID=3040348 RepID=A0ABY8KZI5_9FLAO|nr:DUF5689 domain-containing protein [Aequorivita sp. Ant34-E75]WGF93337.1 DUF5689 domain-containing protein [Aequorivita sp. Ant34-E75]
MKNFKNIKQLVSLLLLICAIAAACVQDDDYKIPDVNVEEPNVVVNENIISIKERYRGYEPKIIEAGDGSNRELYIEAYVISSDETGNIYKSLVIQDKPENPTAGVAISTNATDLYTKYEPGRKIYFRVDGLYIGRYAELPTIGTQDGDEIGRINIEDFEERILRSTETDSLIPQIVTISEAADNDNNAALLNTLVKFEDVQFPDGLAGVAHYANPDNTYGVNRDVENCESELIALRTSGFADFKGILLPEGNGSITAILSRFNDDVQLIIRDIDDVQMEGERCDEGGGGTGGAIDLPFSENFENQPADVPVTMEGWANINVNDGAKLFMVEEHEANKYTQMSAYNSNENPCEVWLVTPGLILPSDSSPTLTFETNDGFYNGVGLFVKISTDFIDDVLTATWTELNANISSGHTSSYGSEFTPSGNVDLSAYAGQVVYIAFQYLGASNGVSTTYQIDTISVVE